jgi:hypothetical protein
MGFYLGVIFQALRLVLSVLGLMLLLFAGSLTFGVGRTQMEQALAQLEEFHRHEATLEERLAEAQAEAARAAGLDEALAAARDGMVQAEAALATTVAGLEAAQSRLPGLEDAVRLAEAGVASAQREHERWCGDTVRGHVWGAAEWVSGSRHCDNARAMLEAAREARDRPAAARAAWDRELAALQTRRGHQEHALRSARADEHAVAADVRRADQRSRILDAELRDLREAIVFEERRLALWLQLEALYAQRDVLMTWLGEEWRRRWPGLLTVVLTLLLAPYLGRAFVYQVATGFTRRSPPLRLADVPTTAPEGPPPIQVDPSCHIGEVELLPGERFCVRPGWGRDMPVGQTRTRWFYAWDVWGLATSWLAGLWLLTEVQGRAEGAPPVRLKLGRSDEAGADARMLRVTLHEHPGLVVLPHAIVGLSDGLQLRYRWSFRRQAWLRGQFRYILLAGTGQVWLEGFGDVTASDPRGGLLHQDASTFVAWEGQLGLRSRVTEEGWAFVLGRGVHLVEGGFQGEGLCLWQKSAGATGRDPLRRGLSAFWSVLGRIFGF